MTKRILVTGSRDWADVSRIKQALYGTWLLLDKPKDAILVHGECHLGGADIIARDLWRGWGFEDEPHPAEIVDGRVLGPKRNREMVSLGADICLAFPIGRSRGTRNCIRLAYGHSIPTYIFEGK